jgi:hypothetical protein
VEQPLARHLEETHAGVAWRRLEVEPGLAAKLNDLQLAVDDHARRREAIERDAVGLVLHGADRRGGLGVLPRRRGQRRESLAVEAHGRQGGVRDHLLIDAVAFVLDGE